MIDYANQINNEELRKEFILLVKKREQLILTCLKANRISTNRRHDLYMMEKRIADILYFNRG